MFDFQSIRNSGAWKAANSTGRTREDSTSSTCFMLVGRKRDYEVKERVIKLRGLDLTLVLKEKNSGHRRASQFRKNGHL